MNRFIYGLIGCLVLAPALAIAAELESRQWDIGDVRYIETGGAVELELRQGDSPSLVAEATAEALEKVIVDIDGDRLTLDMHEKESGFWGWFKGEKEQVKFVLQVSQPLGLVLQGASKAKVADISVPEFTLEANGASQVQMDTLTAETLNVRLSGATQLAVDEVHAQQATVSLVGASKLKVNGTSALNRLDVEANGASKFYGFNVAADDVTAEATGASRVEVTVHTALNASANGASHVIYAGEPRVKKAESGASRVSQKD